MTEKFDAYGEVLPDAAGGHPETAASAMLGRVGQYAFWLLVVVIVSVRIIYYPAAPAFQVGASTDVKHTVTR
ncbi:MAG: hypothetical protein ABIL01_28315 [Pseudomonadota bacterium]